MYRDAHFVEPRYASVDRPDGISVHADDRLIMMTGPWAAANRMHLPNDHSDIWYKALGAADATGSVVCVVNPPYMRAMDYDPRRPDELYTRFLSATGKQMDAVSRSLKQRYDTGRFTRIVHHGQSGGFIDAVARTQLQHDALPTTEMISGFEGIGLHAEPYGWAEGVRTSADFDKKERAYVAQGGFIQPSHKYQQGLALRIRQVDVAWRAGIEALSRAQLWRRSIVPQLFEIATSQPEVAISIEFGEGSKPLYAHLGGMTVAQYTDRLYTELTAARRQNRPERVRVVRKPNTTHASYDNLPYHSYALARAIQWAESTE